MNQWAIMGIVAGGVVASVALVLFMAGGSKAPPGSARVKAPAGKPLPKGNRPCGGCRRAMLPTWSKCMFCGWAPVARLEFIHGPIAGTTLELTQDVTTLGSVAGNTVVLADPGVSRKHAGIRRDDGYYELADLGSTNGVYVNGHKVPKQRLAPGDVIRVGSTEAIFRPA